MKALNARNGKVLSDNVSSAEGVFERMKGLLGRTGLDKGESLWIKPCRGIHTIGMRFAIDVLFLDSDNMVVAGMQDMVPNRLSRVVAVDSTVLELPAGILAATDTREGDKISFIV